MDCGDFGGRKVKSQYLKVRYLLKGMSLLKYDAINLAEKDLQYGREFLEDLRKEYQLPFISANVHYSGTKKLFAKPYVIKKLGGVKIGIFGVTKAEGMQRFVSPETGFEISDPFLAAQASVEKLRKKCDVVIALSHLGLNGSRELAKKVQGIDIIISGHQGKHLRQPEQIGNTVIMQTGSQGKYLGQIDFRVSSNKFALIEGKTVALSKKIVDDAALSKVIKEYDEALLAAYPMESPKATKKFTPLSEKSCMVCHRSQYLQWRTTLHYHAWETLLEEKQNHNPECQQCHTTRFGEPNGFTTINETPYFVNVQCAECHREANGDILKHINRFRRKPRSAISKSNGQAKSDFRPITEQICLKCHNEDNSPNFSYQSYLTKVTH
ncbi:MAG: multiheme c-type cytochrome [bacterium]